MKERVQLFLMAVTMVFLVSCQMYQIANGRFTGAMITAFILGIVWSLTIKAIAFGNNLDRVVYSVGAVVGTGLSMGLTDLIY